MPSDKPRKLTKHHLVHFAIQQAGLSVIGGKRGTELLAAPVLLPEYLQDHVHAQRALPS